MRTEFGDQNLFGPVQPPRPLDPILNAKLKQGILLNEVWQVIRLTEAMNDPRFKDIISQAAFKVAVLDTGINPAHPDFGGPTARRVVWVKDFTLDQAPEGNPHDPTTSGETAKDRVGHGTHVAGIIGAANAQYRGIADKSRIVAIKVLDDQGVGSFARIALGLRYVLEYNKRPENSQDPIRAVNISFGNRANYQDHRSPYDDVPDAAEVHDAIRDLTRKSNGVSVVVSSGNGFYSFGSRPGMACPAIFPQTISVGALYDYESDAPRRYKDGAIVYSTKPLHVTPFTQRLHRSLGGRAEITVFAPGSRITSTAYDDLTAPKVLEGTSQAAPVVTGAVLLLQQYNQSKKNKLLSVRELKDALQAGVLIKDGDDEDNNAEPTRKTYRSLDIVKSLEYLDSKP